MLTLYQSSSLTSQRFIERRNFLHAGFLGLGGLTLPWLLQAKAMAVKSGLPTFVKDRSVVLLFLGGGASHIETFNPNGGASEPYRSVTGEVKTSIPGVSFGSTFPELAKRAHRMAIVRSMQHERVDHEQSISMMLTGGTDPDGKRKEGFGMGAAHARVLGPTVDKALSAFLDDLEQRGLSHRVLTIITGDFGRTPKLNNGGGRDHWSGLCTLALAGGGLSMGQVIGKSGAKNDVPNSEPIGIEHLLGTIFHYLFDVASLRLAQGMPREILKLTENTKFIRELF